VARCDGAAIYGVSSASSRPALVRFTQAIAMVIVSRPYFLLRFEDSILINTNRWSGAAAQSRCLLPGTTLIQRRIGRMRYLQCSCFRSSELKYMKQNTLHGIKAISELTKLRSYRCEEEVPIGSRGWPKHGSPVKCLTANCARVRQALMFPKGCSETPAPSGQTLQRDAG
jgi:hypothetical protein